MKFNYREPIIYLISGKTNVGKDIVTNIIKEYYKNKKVIITGYTKYLKMYTKEYLGWNGNDSTKPREFLQQFGTEIIRNKIDPLFHVNRTIEDVKVYSYLYDIVIINDARTKDEIDIIKTKFNKVYAIKLVRNNYDDGLTIKEKKHSTETDLDNYNKFDYVVENKTIDKLREDITKIIKEIDHE